MSAKRLFCFVFFLLPVSVLVAQPKAIFIILDGISADVLEKVSTPAIDEIASCGAYTRAYTGGLKGHHSQSPTVSAVGYNHILTGTWSYKHNVWDNAIKEPNYHYWNIFRLAKQSNPALQTAIFSTWLDNRTKLVGDGLPEAGNITIDYAFDGFELNEEKFPHDPEKKYILAIDEYVADEAARYIREQAPDLSWVYLEYTDDAGHRYGDGVEYEEAIRKADGQVNRIWESVKYRESVFKEDWLVLVTTDHGRDATTGKEHGGQSDRERTVWISTNSKKLNEKFGKQTAAVDILPSMVRHMDFQLPLQLEQEWDGIPFIGKISLGDLTVTKRTKKLLLSWTVYDPQGVAEIYVSVSNHFKEGVYDPYALAAKRKVAKGSAELSLTRHQSDFYKIVIKAPFNTAQAWVFVQ
ncbi:MAG: alkaline phosphatase family protein [Cyclobacteriaceae bacterium]|nr:alkaline phosphatase family protein [Cyclobacteriaceae bacterium]UYN86475.1 MAG: alkaline phosphatase family protein [Cyclobacteriaceae bacterium]